jgi:O-acetylhomoserine/O-acetylserine sulfhydrylase-like pyridoxal-dependent enzyme
MKANIFQHGAEMFKGQVDALVYVDVAKIHHRAPGHVYSRLSNATVDVLEKRMAALEGGVAAVAASSGQSAQVMTLLGLCDSGHNIIAP